MIGSIIGDIVGSIYEFDNIKTKEFPLFQSRQEYTDDSILTFATADWLMNGGTSGSYYLKYALENPYPMGSYGTGFIQWVHLASRGMMKPYNSCGNGSAMRVGPVGWACSSKEEVLQKAKESAECTHNHPEGIKGAQATALCIFMARKGDKKEMIRDAISREFGYNLSMSVDEIRGRYSWGGLDEAGDGGTCQGSVPQAIVCALDATSLEDAIRNAISIGGDSDTLAAITGGIAEAYYGIPAEIRKHALTFLDELQLSVLNEFEAKFGFTSNKKTENGSRVVKYVPISVNETRRVETTVSEREQSMLDAVNSAESADAADVEWKKTTSTMLFNHLFEACNILRGPINQDEFKTYVIPLLFFKRVSDTYDEETQIACEEYGEDVADFDEDEIHKFIIPEGCHWVDVRTQSENVGAAIVNAMIGIERANPDTLSGLFSSFDDANWTDKNKLSDERLKDLIEHMSRLKVGNKNYSADVMGDAYEFLLKKFADLSKKNAGEFYTPRSVVKLLVKILAPKAGETVYEIILLSLIQCRGIIKKCAFAV